MFISGLVLMSVQSGTLGNIYNSSYNLCYFFIFSEVSNSIFIYISMCHLIFQRVSCLAQVCSWN